MKTLIQTHPRFRAILGVVAGCLVLQVAVCDGEGTGGCTLDLPLSPGQALPVWLEEPLVSTSATFGRIDFPIRAPTPDADLAVTCFFEETEGGFLRASWTGSEKAEMLCNNLYEGIGMLNQRTLVIEHSRLSTPGILTFQASDHALPLSRIHWEWVQPRVVLAAQGAPKVALVQSQGRILDEADVGGDPPLAPSDLWRGRVITAVLTEKPVRIEDGVDFVATLEAAPEWARLETNFAGVSIGKTVALWVNGTRIGEVSIEVPDLSDPGYRKGEHGEPQYVGWRKGAISIPAQVLRPSDNTFQFELVDPKGEAKAMPIAAKNLLLQLKYGDSSPSTNVVAPLPHEEPVTRSIEENHPAPEAADPAP
ncbi:MAG: hypothetical protein HY360_05460 [Verrucomicrobia bacterium]|nr:hypothetical protein [Verrucomicrobiota bacterium]